MTIINKMRDLAHSGGPSLALITKADLSDLVCLLDQCVSTGGGDILTQALMRNVELRNEVDSVRQHCHQLADLSRKKDREARNHGEERRRYMANNKALQARVKDLEEEAEEYHHCITNLSKNASKHGQERRKMRSEILLLRTKVTLVRSAIE